MKLRKALEKAKKERGEDGGRFSDGTTISPTKTGWTPPVYQDTRVVLDTGQLAENRCVCIFPDEPALDDYKVLRTQMMRQAREKGWRTFMITSALPGEGKTLTAVNLAITFAREHNQTALLVDADFRQQQVHKLLGFESDLGIVDYLTDGRELKDMLIWPSIEKLTIISGGNTALESAELLASPAMNDLVQEMKTRYDDRYVLFDVPALLEGADALAFAQHVDGIVVVVSAGRTPMPELKKAVEMLPEEKFLGFILNRAKSV